METRGDRGRGQCPDVVHVKEEPEHSPPLNCEPTIPRGNLCHSHDIHLGNCSTITAENHVEVHIKGEPKVTSLVHDVKEEALCVDEGELQSSGSHGVSAAAMLAALYTDHTVMDELLLGPELLNRPSVTQSGLGACRQSQEAGLVKEPPEHSPQPGGARTLNVHIKEEPKGTSLVHDVKEEALCVDEGELQSSGSHGVSAAAMLAALYTDHTVKDELLLGPELLHRPSVTQSDPPCVAAPEPRVALALCAWDHTYAATGSGAEGGGAVSPDAGVAEALGRRCSVRLERLLLDAERRACRVGRRTYRLRPESEPRRAATPAAGTYRCDHCDKTFAYKSVLSEHIHTHLSTKLAQSRYSTREDSNLDQQQKLDTSLKGNLQSHESTLTREKHFQCNYCDFRFSQKRDLRIHEMKHTGVKPYQSNFCDFKCSRKGNLKRHKMTHTRVQPFHCDYCDYKCSQKGYLRIHKMTHTGVKPFQCHYCDYKCIQKGNLRIHEMTHTGVKPFQCDFCDYKCTVKRTLRIHEMRHTGLEPFKCNYCDYKCSVKGNLRIHEMTHTGEKPFQCNYCDYKCTHKWALRRHEMTHTRLEAFKCNYCDYKCNRKGNLRRHEMTHTGVKPYQYQCDYCDYKCSQKGDLRRHKMKHTGLKPFKCIYCDYKFVEKRELRMHEMRHTGVKPFKCKYCDYKCIQKRQLTTHEIKHTRLEAFNCNYCDYKCNHKGNLRRHEMTHTGVKSFQSLS